MKKKSQKLSKEKFKLVEIASSNLPNSSTFYFSELNKIIFRDLALWF